MGILAGLGPLAGAHFYRRLVELTPAHLDSEHLSVVLVTDNTMPSRLDHLEGHGVSIGIPVLNLLSLVADALDQKGCRRVGIVATTPTRDYHLYEGVLNDRGIETVYPDQDTQDEIMNIIHGVKSTHRREP